MTIETSRAALAAALTVAVVMLAMWKSQSEYRPQRQIETSAA